MKLRVAFPPSRTFFCVLAREVLSQQTIERVTELFIGRISTGIKNWLGHNSLPSQTCVAGNAAKGETHLGRKAGVTSSHGTRPQSIALKGSPFLRPRTCKAHQAVGWART